MTVSLVCLALAVYFEARSQPLLGQLAVAQVVLNRVESERFPDTICEVVYQGGEHRRWQCHFSWYCDGLSDTPYEELAWEVAQLVASAALDGTRHAPLDGATHYHAEYVAPTWSDRMTFIVQIGEHLFYTEEL